MSEPAEEKLARLTRERDEMASRPCDCTRCDCGNIGDAQAVAAWDAEAALRQTERDQEGRAVREWREGFYSVLKERDEARTALAESERKRVECLGTCPEITMANAGRAEAQAAHLRSLDHLAALGDDLHRAKTQAVQLVDLRRAGERYGLTLGQADILWSGALEARTARLATPTQETPHVEI